MNDLLRFLLVALLLGGGSVLTRGADPTPPFTLDLPFSVSAATPVWLGHPVAGTGPFASLSLPITPPDANASLLVTVFFQEQNGGFLRISWQSGTTVPSDDALPGPGEAALSSVLSDNFYEGIGMGNQRGLLVSPDVMKQGGSLCFQTGGTTLGITRIRLEWLDNTTELASPAIHDVLVTPAGGPTQPAFDLAGLPPLVQDPAWHGRIVDVPVTDMPLRIEQGLDFTVQLDAPPALARIALKEAGLPWGQHLVVWVNGQRAGILVPATPPLDNGGYGTAATDTYIGWREGTFFVPVTQLTAGPDTLQFSAEPDTAPETPADPAAAAAPLAVKDVVLQLAYDGAAPLTPATPTAVTSAPTAAATSPAATTVTPASSTSPTLAATPSDSATSTTPASAASIPVLPSATPAATPAATTAP